MNFGDKLRKLRKDKGFTQPELATAMGIEQSYLSKLENNRSLPSNDVLQRILDVFDTDIGTLVDDLDQGVRNQLRQIPDIAEHFNHRKQVMLVNRKRWLLAWGSSMRAACTCSFRIMSTSTSRTVSSWMENPRRSFAIRRFRAVQTPQKPLRS